MPFAWLRIMHPFPPSPATFHRMHNAHMHCTSLITYHIEWILLLFCCGEIFRFSNGSFVMHTRVIPKRTARRGETLNVIQFSSNIEQLLKRSKVWLVIMCTSTKNMGNSAWPRLKQNHWYRTGQLCFIKLSNDNPECKSAFEFVRAHSDYSEPNPFKRICNNIAMYFVIPAQYFNVHACVQQ